MYITLDASLSPSENAQKLFRLYRRKQAAAQRVPSLIEDVALELAHLDQLDTEIALAEDRAQLDQIERGLQESGHIRGQRVQTAGGAGEPLQVRSPDGTLILVGRNSRQNEEVTFSRGGSDDVWLHAHGVPGSHVVIKSAGGAIEEETLVVAAGLAAYYSAARNEGRVQVDYTPRRYVRRIRGGRPGMVIYRHQETLIVAPAVGGLAEGE